MRKSTELVKQLILEKKSDFYVFKAEINDNNVDEFIYLVRDKENKNEICSLILTTNGGDPDAGYRLVRFIKKYYDKFCLYVFGMCKSTGTLIALGADEIIMSDFGEFGPLDIQLTREDELSSTSGLNYLKSLDTLNQQISQSFEHSFLNIKGGSGGTITTRTAGELASKLAVGLISPISAQLDPVRLGEVTRAMLIAESYGIRINDNKDLVIKLITDYPTHSFVIDFKEAVSLFQYVRFVDDEEKKLERALIKSVRKESRVSVTITDLSDIVKDEEAEKEEQSTDEINNSNDDVVTNNIQENNNFAPNEEPNEHNGTTDTDESR